MLGFNAQTYVGPGRYESENVVNIMKVNFIMVHCDIIGASRLNGQEWPIIYSFFPNVGPGGEDCHETKELNITTHHFGCHFSHDMLADGSKQ